MIFKQKKLQLEHHDVTSFSALYQVGQCCAFVMRAWVFVFATLLMCAPRSWPEQAGSSTKSRDIPEDQRDCRCS